MTVNVFGDSGIEKCSVGNPNANYNMGRWGGKRRLHAEAFSAAVASPLMKIMVVIIQLVSRSFSLLNRGMETVEKNKQIHSVFWLLEAEVYARQSFREVVARNNSEFCLKTR